MEILLPYVYGNQMDDRLTMLTTTKQRMKMKWEKIEENGRARTPLQKEIETYIIYIYVSSCTNRVAVQSQLSIEIQWNWWTGEMTKKKPYKKPKNRMLCKPNGLWFRGTGRQ